MALGFQDCCNGLNFFLLAETPASISEFEVYSIKTQEGPTFCATYVNLPTLNYQPPIYHAVSLTQQISCDNCITIVPCPTEETIFHSQFGEGSVITTSDCTVTTIRQMQVQCFPTSPTYENSLDGELDLFINNGTPPYIISDYNTGEIINAPRLDDFYKVLTGISAGTYNFVVSDFTADFVVPISCLVTAPPPLPVFGCNTQDATFYEKPDGILDFIVLSAGTPPYRYYFGNSQFEFTPPINAQGGTYNIRYEDQYYVQYIECTIGQPPEVIWPDKLCMTFSFCGTNFRLAFSRQSNPIKLDYRAWYLCDNPEQVGVERLVLSYNEDNPGGWFIEEVPIIYQIQFSVPCLNGQTPIDLNIPTFAAIKSDISNDQPSGNDWKILGALASPANLTDGPCGLSLTLLSTQDFLVGTNPTLGKVVFDSQGGDGTIVYFVESKNGTIVSKSPIIDNLKDGDYTAYAQDTFGNKSSTITFTIKSVDPFFFIEKFTPCVISSYKNTWLTQIPGGSSTLIERGESRESTVVSSFSHNFNYLPLDTILTARIKIVLDAYTVVGTTGFDDPNIVSTITTQFSTMYSVTDGVINYFMNNITPTNTVFPLMNNGNWYKVSNGNACCIDPTTSGLNWKRQIVWMSEQITIKNDTTFNTSMNNIIVNKIPYLRTAQMGCSTSDSCSGYIEITGTVSIEGIRVVSGPIYLSQTNKEIYRFTFRTSSDGTADWFGSKPTPSC